MKYKIIDLEDNASVILDIYKEFNDNHMELGAVITRKLTADKVVVELDYSGDKILNFGTVQIDVHYSTENGVPIIWRGAKVVYCKGQYVLCTTELGVKTNRRSSFRVSVGNSCWLTSDKHKNVQTVVKDISLVGFSIIDRKKELKFDVGDKAGIRFDDLCFEISLVGTMVRMEEQEGYFIYGFTIDNLCKDLSSYLSLKQRKGYHK